MFDHITIRVDDIEETKEFYSQVLKPLGYALTKEQKFGEVTVIGFGKDGKSDSWFTTDRPVSGPVHIAWKAESKEQVNDFYRAAIGAGGKCKGKPGGREYKHSDYYAAFIIDPNGHNIEAVFGN